MSSSGIMLRALPPPDPSGQGYNFSEPCIPAPGCLATLAARAALRLRSCPVRRRHGVSRRQSRALMCNSIVLDQWKQQGRDAGRMQVLKLVDGVQAAIRPERSTPTRVHYLVSVSRARARGPAAGGFDPGAPASSYEVASVRADRNRWPRAGSTACVLSGFSDWNLRLEVSRLYPLAKVAAEAGGRRRWSSVIPIPPRRNKVFVGCDPT